MTGLNPDSDRIIEIAMVVTNSNLEVIAEAPTWVIHQSDEVLNGMDECGCGYCPEAGNEISKNVKQNTSGRSVLSGLSFTVLRGAPGVEKDFYVSTMGAQKK